MEKNKEKESNQITDLQQMMFQQMARLSDPNCDLDKEIKRSQAIVSVGHVIVNSAKTQVEFLKASKMTDKSEQLPKRKQLNNDSK